ncbi:MAG: XdhC family protein [Paracoccus sp. (in: a-proteobacteria)]|nr:XdhC family protein [Paracoccus sp. (in: a-proteobacteria)]
MSSSLTITQDPSCRHPAMLDPWRMALEWGPGSVLAVLTATYGPAYRNPGATMAISPDGRFAGAITSGCVEADIILRTKEVRQTRRVQNLRYGQGSPFFDLRLPCGGAVEVRLFALQDMPVIADLARLRAHRRPVSLILSADGRLSLGQWRPTGGDGADFHIGFRPDLRFLVFGTGAEAAAFAGLVRGMGYDHMLLSHEESSLAPVRAAGSPTRLIGPRLSPERLRVDTDTAAVLFYHDHDYEPTILRQLVHTPAFYIGAQGSRATQAGRLAHLREMGLSDGELARIHGPIGLIPSSRDPNSLAISVLAEIVGLHGKQAEPLGR